MASDAVDDSAAPPVVPASPASATPADGDASSAHASGDISDADIATTVRVLAALCAPVGRSSKKVAPRDEYTSDARYRGLRKALAPFVERHASSLFGDSAGKTEYEAKKAARRAADARRMQQKQFDQHHMNTTKLRQARLAMRDSLQKQAAGVSGRLLTDGSTEYGAEAAAAPAPAPAAAAATMPLIPDGAAVDEEDKAALSGVVGAGAGAGAARGGRPAVAANAPPSDDPPSPGDAAPSLHKPNSCYVCKRRFWELHEFYSNLCPSCAALNYAKRLQTASMHGKVALVTGARVKIGFHVALKLLRAGCTVIATSRFPRDAARRYAAAAGFAEWGPRLHVYGADFRDLRALESLCDRIRDSFPRLDVIVNNACQTVRRPPTYYAHLVRDEVAPAATLTDDVRRVLAGNATWTEARGGALAVDVDLASGDAEAEAAPAAAASGTAAAAAATVPHHDAILVRGPSASSVAARAATEAAGRLSFGDLPSALQSQVPVAPSDRDVKAADVAVAFPAGHTDVNGQQLDLRTHNSWLLKISEVQTAEVAECLAINTIAPFVINGRLLPMMQGVTEGAEAPPCAHAWGSASDVTRGVCRCGADAKFVVNVSAMEGKFSRHKLPTHPHTNAAKAALNMMTRTCAADLAQRHVYMTSVDTGWINDENPLEKAAAHAAAHNFQTPIDEVDAAARIVDPVFDVLNGGRGGIAIDDELARAAAASDEVVAARTRGGAAAASGAGDCDGDRDADGTGKSILAGVFLKDYHQTDW